MPEVGVLGTLATTGLAAPPPLVIETHSALLFAVGDLVYKVKKPVDLGFLDYTRRETRREVCQREVELNRRLSPDVYLGVYDVLDPSGQPWEHVVVMRRMPQDRSLSSLVLAGRVTGSDLLPLARLLARFHSGAQTSPEIEDAGSASSLMDNWRTGLEQVAELAPGALPAAAVDRMRSLAERYLSGRGPLLDARRRRGLMRDGHGDLLCADIYLLADGPRVLDCLEFDDRLRYGDVLLDLAFLGMDLEDLGRPDLASDLVNAYDELSGHPSPRSLLEHYVAYRAQVRSKVALVRWRQGDEDARARAARLAELCLAKLEASAVRLVLVGGLPGTGKSTVAAAVADERGWTLLRSDVLRKQQADLQPDAPASAPWGAGLYDRKNVDRTYEEMLRRARLALGMGESVVLDASWSSPRWRAAAAGVAAETSSDLLELVCQAPAVLAEERLRDRARRGGDASDAGPDIARAMAAEFEPWPSAVVLDTSQPTGRSLAVARRTWGPSAHDAGGATADPSCWV